MKTQKTFLVSALVTALAMPLLAQAADAPRCNDLFDDAQRLGCYDAVFGKPVHTGAMSNAPAAPVAPAGAATAAAAGTAAAVASAAAAPTAPAPQPAQKAAKPQAYKTSITALSLAADGRFIATVENGQKWLQQEKDSRVEVKVGDTVTMQPMMFDSWTMVTKNGYVVRLKHLN